MMNFNKSFIGTFLFVFILPFSLMVIVYYGFESYYFPIKNRTTPPGFLFSNVYAYRVIPNYINIKMYSFTNYFINHFFTNEHKHFVLKNGSSYYHSIFVTNTFFFILVSFIIQKIINFKSWINPLVNDQVRRIVHLICIFYIAITQYVPMNVDSIAIFFYTLGLFLSLKFFYEKKIIYLILLLILEVLSTYTRETSALNIAFLAALLIDIKNSKLISWRVICNVSLMIIAFLIPYISLRFMLPQNATILEGIYISKNFSSPFNIIGLVFSLISLYFAHTVSYSSTQKQLLLRYLIFSLPYLLMITLVGLFWEIRLFLPLILTAFILSVIMVKAPDKG